MLQAYDCCVWREKQIAATRVRAALIGKAGNIFCAFGKVAQLKRQSVRQYLGTVLLTG
jgi:hypothetical protein